MSDSSHPTVPGGGAPEDAPRPDSSATERERRLEEILSEFLLRREEGETPAVEDYLARYPKYAEDLAFLLAEEVGAALPPTVPGSEAATFEPEPGAPLLRVGPYEILEPVAKGGGGAVYRARHHRDHHVVALKVLDRIAVGDARDLERFQREAQLLRSLDLVSVVPVYEVGEDQGRLFIAMKWIEGSTLVGLREAVNDPAHPLHDRRERARLIARVARTFGAVHACGILHRDVKPSNVMVDRLLEPALIDFGIAQAPELGDLTLTADSPMGTPRYIAPELLAGGNARVSPQSDIYGLGLCLYELAAGVRVFEDEGRGPLPERIQRTGPPDPRRINRDVPHALEAIILRAIERDPRKRYPSMADFAADLERFARGEAPEPLTLRRARPLRRFLLRYRRGLPVAAGLLIVLAAAGIVAGMKIRRADRIGDLEAVLRPYELAPPEVLPFDHAGLERAALELKDLEPGRAEAGLRGAWVFFMSGDYAHALQVLTVKQPAEPPSVALFRDYLHLITKRFEAGGSNVREATITGMSTDKDDPNRAVGTRHPSEIGSVLELTEAENRRRQQLEPPFLDQVAPLLKSSAAPDRPPEFRLLRAVLAWHSLPSDLDPQQAESVVGQMGRLVERILAQDPGLLWARYLRAVLVLRYGDAAAARGDLDVLAAAFPSLGAIAHVRALVHALPIAPGGDADLASREFARAAAIYEAQRQAGAETTGDRLAWDPLRKLYGCWALHEVERGRGEEAGAVLDRWTAAFPQPLWQDRMFPLLIRAALEERTGRIDQAIELLHQAGATNSQVALPLFEEARIVKDDRDDPAEAKRLLREADERPVKVPDSVVAFLRGNYYGLRPYSLKQRFTTGWVEDEEPGPSVPEASRSGR